MKRILLPVLLIISIGFTGCSKSESTIGLTEVIRGYATVSGDQWVKNNRLYARFSIVPADEFPVNPTKIEIEKLISNETKAAVDFSDVLPLGDYVLIMIVSEHNERYPTLTDAYTYKKVTLSKGTVVRIMEFDYDGGTGYHPWKDGILKSRN